MIIVSLTTTKQRLELCRQTLISIMFQSLKPDKVVIWLSKEPYLRDSGVTDTPSWLEELNGLKKINSNYPQIEINWTENTGPYRKLIPVLKACDDEDIIVTADDDIIYGTNWLKQLVSEHFLFPEMLIACRVRKISKNFFGKEKTYLKWPVIKEKQTIDSNYCITHGGGAVFKKSFINKKYIYIDDYLEIAPTTDDLWYSQILNLSGTSVRVIPEVLKEIFFIKHQDGLLNYNLPMAGRLYHKLKLLFIDKPLGSLGLSVCNNDIAYKNIKEFFH